MLFTRKFITLFVPEFASVSDETFTKAVNALGMEVESIKKYDIPNNCVIGQLMSFTPIEGTHLNYCDVKISKDVTNKIVCGASGLIAGKKVIVALEGAKLPNGITIAKRVIRGNESNGMMCAYSELTNNKDVVADAEADEIIMLDEGTVGSNNWAKYIGLDDTIYDISVPANRNDENSYLVFCYEIANKLNIEFKYDLKQILKALPSSTNQNKVDKDVCSFLSFQDFELTQKHIGRSKWDNKAILMNHGIKPINYILDKLAIITLLTNCPTHVYDANKLVGNLTCGLAKNSTKFIGLNDKTYTLTNNDILIYDQNQPVSIACVIGSNETKLTSNTSVIRIEVGNFAFANVRNTALRLNCETDAARKASKPLSNYLNLVTVALIKKNFGTPIKETLSFKPNWFNDSINLDWNRLGCFINEPIDKQYVSAALKKQGYDCNIITRMFRPAPWRLDVTNQEDMFEDILKILDINKLKPISIVDKLLPFANNYEYDLKQSVKDVLINNYFNEVKTYNLTNRVNIPKFNFFDKVKPVRIICNNANREYFRLSMIDNMLKVYQYNQARKLDLIPIFEIQKLFTNESKNINLSCLCLDKIVLDPVTNSTIATNLNYLIDCINTIVGDVFNNEVEFEIEENPYCYGNESITIYYKDEPIGYMGKIKKSLLKDYDLENSNIYCLTINIEKLIEDYKPYNFKFKPFGVFQRLTKDINITLVKEKVYQVNEKIDRIRQIQGIEDARVISVFNKDNCVVYTVRYQLIDTKQFTTLEIDNIQKLVEQAIL